MESVDASLSLGDLPEQEKAFSDKRSALYLFLLCQCMRTYDKLMALGMIKLVDFASADFSILSHS